MSAPTEIQPEVVHVGTWDTFKSEATGEPFAACSACSQPFQEQEPLYLIEKEFERAQPNGPPRLVYEFALCDRCLSELEASLSVGSRNHVAAFYHQRVNLDARASTLLAGMRNARTLDIHDWVSRCMFTGEAVETLPRYRIIAQGFGHWLPMAAMPAALSDTAVNLLHSGLSAKSIEAGRRFAADRLGFVPQGRRSVALV